MTKYKININQKMCGRGQFLPDCFLIVYRYNIKAEADSAFCIFFLDQQFFDLVFNILNLSSELTGFI